MKSKSLPLRIAAIALVVLIFAGLIFAWVKTSKDKELPEDPSAVTTADSTAVPASPWDSATYTESKTFGEGTKTFELEIKVDTHSVTFTVHTDEDFLGAPLLAHGIVTGEMGPYGLYILSVNGITADYDKDQAYWSISKGGDNLMTGADTTPIENGAHYELTYTKG